MNKRYIDFVPAKRGRVDLKGSPFSKAETTEAVTKTVEKPKSGVALVATKKIETVKSTKIKATAKDTLGKGSVGLGKIESKKSITKSTDRSADGGVNKVTHGAKMEIPKNPFINTAKVTKRPLSKNVYKKEVKAPAEEPKGPVTIIAKPDKGAHVGLIVTIILTIVLGAAAGTVAFLLLPK